MIVRCRIASGDPVEEHYDPQRPGTPLASRGPRPPPSPDQVTHYGPPPGPVAHYGDEVVVIEEARPIPPPPPQRRMAPIMRESPISPPPPSRMAPTRRESPKNAISIKQKRGVVPGAPHPKPVLVSNDS